MCGIAGYYGRPASSVDNSVLERLAHRGPDGRGRFDADCGLLSLFHTRLAILDPTARGAQPMTAADGRIAITFNGEIYNFPALRRELEGQGAQFHSHTDTEVLLQLYLRDGTAMLEHLNGDYAFALWDARDSSLFVARDPLGVKPLYFSTAGDAFAFASEIKALLCFPWIPRRLHAPALAHYIQHLWCPAPETALADVQKLESGTAIVVRAGRIEKHWRHHELPAPGPDPSRPLDDWIEAVRNGLDKAVERQMLSDVPVGAFLSGGLDSSAVVSFARRHTSNRLQCFTLDFDAELAGSEGIVRDLPYAQRVARHLDVDLHIVRVGADIADQLERMVWQLDEPQADFAALNVLFISEFARSHGIKVLLSGAGGDDLFTGYRRHRAISADALWDHLPVEMRHGLARFGACLPVRWPATRRIRKLLSAVALEGNARIASYFDWPAVGTVQDLFVPDIARTLTRRPLVDALDAMPASLSPLQRMLLLEQRFFLGDHNLNYTDKMSMAAGVETRVPFLDNDLVALAARIPDDLRQRRGVGKWILKKAMENSLPRDVIYRPKTGFGVPLRTWLQGPLQASLRDLLSDATLRRRGLFNPAVVARMIDDNTRGRVDHAYPLLALMCIELWLRRFID